MISPPAAAALVLVGWLLTYLLHSTILLGGAWAASRLLHDRGLRVQDALWKVALVGALLTSTLQVGAGVEPVLGVFELGLEPMRLTSGGAEMNASPVTAADGSGAVGASHLPGASLLLSPAVAVPLLAVWSLIAFAALVRLGIGARRFRRRLRRRPPRRDERYLVDMLASLAGTAGLVRTPALTFSAHLASPLAMGGEICLPDRWAHDLSSAELRGVLAHEMAHLRRRDPSWAVIAATLVALFPFQPLLRQARRRLRETAELLCDDWSCDVTGRPLPLARALLAVAERVGEPARAGVTTAFASGPSGLTRRVERLLAERSSSASEETALPAIAVAIVMVLTVAFAPGFQSTMAEVSGDAAAIEGTPEAGEAHVREARPAEAGDSGELVGSVPVGEDSRGSGPVVSERSLEIRAVDPAGRFTVSLRDGRVVAATIEGIPIPERYLEQTTDSLHFLGPDGGSLFSVRVREDGITWEARPASWSAPLWSQG